MIPMQISEGRVTLGVFGQNSKLARSDKSGFVSYVLQNNQSMKVLYGSTKCPRLK